jgi:hypothetical protein
METGCAGRYNKLATKRDYFLDRARECAELTLPSLLPPEGFTPSSDLYTPYQSVGARGVNNLASKLLLLLLPPNVPFFRLMTEQETAKELEGNPEVKQQIELSLSQIERSVMDELEAQSVRVSIFEALKHLLITGNILVHMPRDGALKVFPMTNFVVRRDAEGEPVEIIVKEMVSKDALPEGDYEDIDAEHSVGSEDETALYTKIVRDGDRFIVYQEIENRILADSYGEYPKDILPWLPLRMVRIDGEDYGRSFVEEVLGDIRSLEALTQALVESAAAASKLVFLVRPNATTRKSDIADANNGDVVTGSSEDVNVLQTEKYNDMRVVLDSVQRIEERLKFAFLLNESVQRQAERVTATEIKYMADEMEAALSGVYSLLSVEFQLPLVRILIQRMQSKGQIPALPKGTVKPVIVTGTAALGRGNDLQKLKSFLSDLIQLTGASPQSIQRINTGDLIRRLATGHGIEVQGLVRSEEELAAQMQQMQQQQMMQQVMQEGIKGAAPAAGKQLVEQGIS